MSNNQSNASTSEALLKIATITSLKQYQLDVGRELKEDEAMTAFMNALRLGNFETMQYLENEFGCGFIDTDTEEERAAFLALTPKEVKAMIEYGNDATAFFPLAYYLADATDAFLEYMRMLDESGRRHAMGNLPGFLDDDKPFDIEHSIVKAYVSEFPYDRTAKEIQLGGVVALKQTVYPEPNSEYTLSRGELYHAEQELQYYDCDCNGEPRTTPDHVERLRQRVQDLKEAM